MQNDTGITESELMAALEGSGTHMIVPRRGAFLIANEADDDVIIDGLTLLDLCFQVEGKMVLLM